MTLWDFGHVEQSVLILLFVAWCFGLFSSADDDDDVKCGTVRCFLVSTLLLVYVFP
jgi:hypothetical protein